MKYDLAIYHFFQDLSCKIKIKNLQKKRLRVPKTLTLNRESVALGNNAHPA